MKPRLALVAEFSTITGIDGPAQIESPTRSAAPPGEDVNLADPLLTCCRPVVAASIVGPTKPLHLAGAVDALDVHVTEDEIRALEEPYTPREPPGF